MIHVPGTPVLPVEPVLIIPVVLAPVIPASVILAPVVPTSVISVIPAPVIPVETAETSHLADIDTSETVDMDHEIIPANLESSGVHQSFSYKKSPSHFKHFDRVAVAIVVAIATAIEITVAIEIAIRVAVIIVKADRHVIAKITLTVDDNAEITIVDQRYHRSVVSCKNGCGK